MSYIPRDYQTEAVQAIWAYFGRAIGNPLVAMPTGTGKSIVIADFLKSVYKTYPNQKILVITHVKELIQQNYEKLKMLWPTAPAGVYSAGLNRRDTMHSIIFAGIGSIAKRAAAFGRVDLVIVDEAHLINPIDETQYKMFLQALTVVNPHMKVIGFTATAWRAGVGKIEGAGLFTDTCFDITGLHAFNRLIDEGYLVPLVPRATALFLDVTGVHMRGGDFVAGELQATIDREEVTEAALKEMLQYGHDRHSWLLFCAGVEHSMHTAEMLTAMGVPCEAVHSKISSSERDRILLDYKSGKLRAVANNNVLTTGFDHPALDLIGMLRPTASPVLWVQMLGRGTRPLYSSGFDLTTTDGRLQSIANSQKRNCLVLDFAGNTKRLGPINDPVIPRRKGEKGGEAPVKLCPCCNTWNHASVRVCFICGSEFLQQVKIKHSASTEELIKKEPFIIEVFKIDHVTYENYQRPGKPPMVKLCYYSGLRKFNEYACFEHDGYAKHRAHEWWRARTSVPPPATTLQALSSTGFLRVATHIRVRLDTKFPEIMAHCFDGSAFGTQEIDEITMPAVSNSAVVQSPSEDEEIPW